MAAQPPLGLAATSPQACLPLVAPAYHVYGRRHLVLLAYTLATATCGLYQNSFAPVEDVFRETFHTSTTVVSTYANVMPLLSIPISFACPALFRRRGLRFGCLLGSALLLAGGWVRYLGSLAAAGTRIWAILLGQALAAAGMPLLLAAIPLLPDAWYGPEGRALATAIASLASIYGSTVASIVAPTFFPAPGPGASRDSQVEFYLFVEALVGTSAFALVLLFVWSAPPTPPSPKDEPADASPVFQRRAGGRHSVLEALHDRSFRLLMVAFGFGYAGMSTLTTLINDVLKPNGYSDDQIGAIGGALGFGVFGAFIFGAIADVTKEFCMIAKTLVVLSLLCNVGFWVCLSVPNVGMWPAFVLLGALGFLYTPILPLCMELGAEVLFPMSASLVGSLLWAAANAGALVGVLIGAGIKAHGGEHSVQLLRMFLAALITASGLCMLPFRGRMRRRTFEARAARSGAAEDPQLSLQAVGGVDWEVPAGSGRAERSSA